MNHENVKQNYKSMYLFLRGYWERTKSEDVGSLLSDLSLLPDGSPADPAAWSDWVAAVEASEDMDDAELSLDIPSHPKAG